MNKTIEFKKNDLVSIIMPAYNCDKYIEESIRSVLNQTYETWELIIIDDCSSDSTVDVVNRISINDSRVKLYRNSQNMGVSRTRNRAIELSTGEWIAFLDSDDKWDHEKLQKQLEYAQKVNGKFIFTGVSYINKEGIFYNGGFEVPKIVDYKKLRKQNVISCSSVLISKELLGSIRMEDDSMHEDYAFWLKILKNGHIAYGINEKLLIYRILKDSKSGNKLKTISMTYKVFRCLELNCILSTYFMVNHVMRSIVKYKRIKL